MTVQGWPYWYSRLLGNPAVTRDVPKYMNMYETRNETTNPVLALVVVAFGRPSDGGPDGQRRAVRGVPPAD